MKEFITEEQIEKALDFLRDSAHDFAEWRSRMKYLEQHRKSIKAAGFLEYTDGTVAEREAKAYDADQYREVCKEYEEAVYEYTLLEAQRAAAEAKIDMFRTISASNRKGNI